MESVLIKISGTLLDAPERLGGLADAVASYRNAGRHVVITHGGGVQITRLSEKLGLPVRQVNGRRITDAGTLDVLLYAVAGALNTRLVHLLQNAGQAAVGLTGLDGALTVAHRRPPQVVEGQEVDFGLVGDLDRVNPALIQHLFAGGYVPVLACVTADAASPLNVNADTLANALAAALNVSEMVVLMDVPAVLDAARQPIAAMTEADFARGRSEGWITAGMLPKLETCFASVRAGIGRVRLASPESLKNGGGTLLTSGKEQAA